MRHADKHSPPGPGEPLGARCIIKNANFIYLPVCVLPGGRMNRLKSTLHLQAALILALVAQNYSLLSLEEEFITKSSS
jgi:hypothetical protein